MSKKNDQKSTAEPIIDTTRVLATPSNSDENALTLGGIDFDAVTPSTTTVNNSRVGTLVNDRYRIEKTIGKGGMGEIYLATDEKLQRQVAIKMMLSPEEERDNRRFEVESQTVAGFTDPHTIRLFDYGLTKDGFQYQVIEYLEGSNVKEFIKSNGPLHPNATKTIGIQLCGSLAEAHRKNILHRDIKPSNIMLVNSPERGLQSKLLDFGLARTDNHDPTMTQTGTVLGSPMYMSPEQIDEKSTNLTPKSDIYSLGLTIYTMVTGNTPFKGGSISGILAAQLFQQPEDPTISQPILLQEPAMCWVIQTATKKDLSNRFSSIKQMQKALELSIIDPKSDLSLEDGRLFNNDEPITELTSASFQSLSIHTTNPEPGLETFKIEPAKSSNKNIIFGLVTVIIILGLLSDEIMGMLKQDSGQPSPTPTIMAPITDEEPVENTIKPVGITTLNIDSSPTGALIHHNEKLLGTTPTTLDIGNEDKLNLVFSKDGYESKSQIVNATEENWTISLTIQSPKPSERIKKQPQEETKENTSPVKQVTNPFE